LGIIAIFCKFPGFFQRYRLEIYSSGYGFYPNVTVFELLFGGFFGNYPVSILGACNYNCWKLDVFEAFQFFCSLVQV
jgi:hypothetical protein